MGKSKREDEALRSLVWDRHERGLSNRQIARDLKICRNKVNAIIKLGEPPEFKRVKEPSTVAEEPSWRKEEKLLADLEARIPAEQKQREATFAEVMKYLMRRRYVGPYQDVLNSLDD